MNSIFKKENALTIILLTLDNHNFHSVPNYVEQQTFLKISLWRVFSLIALILCIYYSGLLKNVFSMEALNWNTV